LPYLCLLMPAAMSYLAASSAQEAATGLFARGNAEYRAGGYASAEKYYREILDSGIESGSLYYNLGNACFKQQRLGDAIYYWEKADQILPADREIRENLELANLLLVDRIEVPEDPLPLYLLSRINGLLSIEQQGILVLILFIAANIFISICILAKNPRYASRAFIASLAVGIVFLIFALSLTWKVYERDFRKKGIVVEQKVDVRSGPGAENIAVFTIHEGIKVRVHGSSDGWYQISLPNGWNGWLPQDYVRIL
jgi:tetratricopeptide (TPR) repeat protein